MAHFARRYPDSTYVSGYVVTGDDFKFWDTNITKCVNGDGGGTWNPAAAIVIGGAGMWFALAATLNFTAFTTTSTGGHIEHDDDDYIEYPGSFRTLASPVLCGTAPRRESLYPWVMDATNDSVTSPAIDGAGQTYAEVPWRFPLRVHDGATVTMVTFYMALGEAHADTPQNPVRFRVVRIDRDGNETPIGTAADADGYVAFAGNYAITTGQTVAYACNEVIDLSKYDYRAEILDEYGANAWATTGNKFFGADAFMAPGALQPQ